MSQASLPCSQHHVGASTAAVSTGLGGISAPHDPVICLLSKKSIWLFLGHFSIWYMSLHTCSRARTHTHTCIYSIHQILIGWFWMVCGSTWFRLIVTATTNIGIVLRSGRRSFDQNTGATAVIYSVHTVQFMIISKQDMTYIVVFSMHQMPAAFWGLKTWLNWWQCTSFQNQLSIKMFCHKWR